MGEFTIAWKLMMLHMRENRVTHLVISIQVLNHKAFKLLHLELTIIILKFNIYEVIAVYLNGDCKEPYN